MVGAVTGGAEGEICLRHEHQMIGYLDDPVATERTLIDGWVHSGDLGTVDARGHLRFLGRIKNMIKRSGENISPEEIETVLVTHADVREASCSASRTGCGPRRWRRSWSSRPTRTDRGCARRLRRGAPGAIQGPALHRGASGAAGPAEQREDRPPADRARARPRGVLGPGDYEARLSIPAGPA